MTTPKKEEVSIRQNYEQFLFDKLVSSFESAFEDYDKKFIILGRDSLAFSKVKNFDYTQKKQFIDFLCHIHGSIGTSF